MAYQATAKTEANKLNRRKKILEVTQQRISEAGFAGVSMADIAREAGIATGSLYRYFPSKQALCTEIFRIYTRIEVSLIESLATQANVSPAEKLIVAIETFSRRAIKSRHMAWSLIAEPLDPALESERLYYRKSYSEIYAQLIEEGIEQGEFHPQITAVSAAAIVGALAESLVGPLSVPPQRSGRSKNPSTTTPDQELLIQNITRFCLSALGYAVDLPKAEPIQDEKTQGSSNDTN